MKYSTRLSDAVHILVFLHEHEDSAVTSSMVAESIRTNPSYVRQLMALLKDAGLVDTSQGRARSELAQQPEDISLLDVYRAVEGRKPLLHLDTHTNPECGVGMNIQEALAEYYDRVQRSAEQSMAAISLRDIIDTFEERIRKLP